MHLKHIALSRKASLKEIISLHVLMIFQLRNKFIFFETFWRVLLNFISPNFNRQEKTQCLFLRGKNTFLLKA